MQRRQASQLIAIAVISGLSASALAHGGLEGSSALMLALHGLAHAINGHPVIVAFLGASAVSGCALYRVYLRGWRRHVDSGSDRASGAGQKMPGNE